MSKARRIIRWTVAATHVGPALIAATDRGVCRLAFGESEADLRRFFPDAELLQGGEQFAALVDQVLAAIQNPAMADEVPLDLAGTDFQRSIWDALRAIPCGETRSYAQIAAAAGRPSAIRAAGSANGANPVAVLVPCHRVVRSDGALGGYAYGAAIKRALLEREGALSLA